MVMPVYGDEGVEENQPIFYTAAPGASCRCWRTLSGIDGFVQRDLRLRIPPVKIVRGGAIDRSVLEILLHNVRTPVEREGDLQAQIGACRVGELRLGEVIRKYQPAMIQRLAQELFDYSERLTRAELSRMPAGEFEAEDFLDDDGNGSEPIRIRVKLTIDPVAATATVDFSGSHPQIESSLNAVLAITYSAVYYVFRCLLPAHAPATAGLMRPITLVAPEGTIVNARLPAPVAGGNVETSQRIVDVLLRALAAIVPHRVPAASSGTMTNLTIGGVDPRYDRPFAYYETTAGGMGARPDRDGVSGVHTHMTNSLNTPVEALEYAYPFRVVRYGYRSGSGGKGRFTGGDGLVRELELLTDAQVTLLADRQKRGPYGLHGGADGTPGRVSILHEQTARQIPGKCSVRAAKGDVVRVETPGGGGWGSSG